MKVEKIGAIAAVEIPDTWIAENQSGVGERVFSPRDHSSARIVFKHRGVQIDEASRKVFSFLLKQNEQRALNEEEILALHTVMGRATVGDNQYTNSNEPGSLEGPHFHLESAGIVQVSERAVLRARGRFQNQSYYNGIFFPAGTGGRIVEEAFLEVPGASSTDQLVDTFDGVLNTIRWT